MTDKEKLEKLVSILIKRLYMHKTKADIGSTEKELFDEKIENAQYEECKDILNIIDSMQEEPNITGISSKQATGKLKECIDNITEESLAKFRKQMEENPKECMYARDNYHTESADKALGADSPAAGTFQRVRFDHCPHNDGDGARCGSPAGDAAGKNETRILTT